MISLGSESTTRVNPSNVYMLDPSWATQFYWGQPRELEVNHFLLASGQVRPIKPVLVVVQKGRKAGDFLWNGLSLVVG